MRRPERPAVDGRAPVEDIIVDRRRPLARPHRGEIHGVLAELEVADDGDQEIGGRRVCQGRTIDVDHAVGLGRVNAEIAPDPVARIGVLQIEILHVAAHEPRGFGRRIADEQRDVGSAVRHDRVIGMVREAPVVDDGINRVGHDLHGRDQLIHGQRLQRFGIGTGEAGGHRDSMRHTGGFLGGAHVGTAGEALHDGFVKQSVRRRKCHQGCNLGGAPRLAEDGHVVGIATESGDIVTDPPQREHHVQHAGIAGIGKSLIPALDLQMAENIDAVIDGHDHHVAVACKAGPVEAGGRAGTVHPGAAMQPDHHRPFRDPGRRWREHVEEETVLADRLDLRVPGGDRIGRAGDLRRRIAGDLRVRDARPGPGRDRRQEAAACGALAVADAAEDDDTGLLRATHLAARRLHDRILGRRGARPSHRRKARAQPQSDERRTPVDTCGMIRMAGHIPPPF